MKNNFFIILAAFSFFTLAFVLGGCESTKKSKTVQELIVAGEIEKAKSLFTNQAEINNVDEDGNTALHVAAKLNESDLVTFLIVKGADTELKNKYGDTPLHVAIANDAYESSRALTSLGADIFALNAKGKSALEIAITKSNVYYDIMINEKTALLRDMNNGNGIVHYFVLTRNQRALLYCINKRLDIDKKNSAQETPLALALKNPDTAICAEIAADLLLAGAEEVECDARYFEDAVIQRNLSMRMDDGQTPLHLAAIYGHTGIAQYLLNKGADIKTQDISGTTPLHEAVRYGNIEIARQLLSKGADVNCKDSLGKTPLLVLISPEKQAETYELLLSHGANVNQKDMYGDTILHIASMTAMRTQILEILIKAGADVNVRNKRGLTPIATSIEHNDVQQVRFYTMNGADIHAEDAKKMTPLISVLSRNDDMYKSLIVKKNVSSTDSEGNTPLIIALKRNTDFSKIEYIANLDSNINARNRDGESALFIAVKKNNRNAGELLLSLGADIFSANTKNVSPLRLALESKNGSEQWILNSETISLVDGSGNTVLHYAAEWRLPEETLELLIQKGCDVNAKNGNGETPVFSAAKSDNQSTILTLAKNDANIQERDNLGSSALHVAVRWDALSAAEQLVNLGIDVNAQNIAGKTPLDEAAVEGSISMASLLIARGANPNSFDTSGRTALSGAVRANNYEMVKLLLSSNANPQIQDMNGRTPYHDAAILGEKKIIDELRKAGANPLTRDKNGTTPFTLTFPKEKSLMYAVLGKDKMLTDSDGNTPVHIAVQAHANDSVITSLVANGYPFDIRNTSGYTPLSLAVASGQKDKAALLLEKGANPFIEINSKGDNAVTLAFKEKSGELLGYIVKYAKNKTDVRGNTLLHYAARLADTGTLVRLLDLGLDKNAKNVSGETPYDVAMNWKKMDNAKLLGTQGGA
ncbi:MAG: ankyrin repeat domain-containing protein [Treponemataceae bacterium]|nr:ankyrin repeat domain-containing protein [Treponemataceae bacterium]